MFNKNNNELPSKFSKAISAVNKKILGKDRQVRLIFAAVLSSGHVLLNDTPGMGKTTLARSMAKVLGMSFGRIQFTSDLMPSDITGLSIPDSNTNKITFHKGPVFNNIVLADEINRASPRTQSAMLEAMDEKQVTIDGITHNLPNPFWVIATQNPVDYSGTFPLPQSQMDRFLLQIELSHPDKENEINMFLGQHEKINLGEILSSLDVVKAREEVDNVAFSSSMANYLYSLVQKTRNHDGIISGLSPRAALSIIHASRAVAWLDLRSFVIPEDIQKVFLPATIHRIHSEQVDVKYKSQTINEILKTTPYIE